MSNSQNILFGGVITAQRVVRRTLRSIFDLMKKTILEGALRPVAAERLANGCFWDASPLEARCAGLIDAVRDRDRPSFIEAGRG